MKKYFSYITMLAMLAVVCVTFTACGGDDKDDDLPEGYVKTTEGVHRIEVVGGRGDGADEIHPMRCGARQHERGKRRTVCADDSCPAR